MKEIEETDQRTKSSKILCKSRLSHLRETPFLPQTVHKETVHFVLLLKRDRNHVVALLGYLKRYELHTNDSISNLNSGKRLSSFSISLYC